jgi:hypothetical protein
VSTFGMHGLNRGFKLKPAGSPAFGSFGEMTFGLLD